MEKNACFCLEVFEKLISNSISPIAKSFKPLALVLSRKVTQISLRRSSYDWFLEDFIFLPQN